MYRFVRIFITQTEEMKQNVLRFSIKSNVTSGTKHLTKEKRAKRGFIRRYEPSKQEHRLTHGLMDFFSWNEQREKHRKEQQRNNIFNRDTRRKCRIFSFLFWGANYTVRHDTRPPQEMGLRDRMLQLCLLLLWFTLVVRFISYGRILLCSVA